MYVSAAALGLAGAAAAAVAAVPAVPAGGPTYPKMTLSKGFRLVVNVTDPSKDFHPSIQNTYINSLHVSNVGSDLIGQTEDANHGLVFYQNGTTAERNHGQSRVLSESITTISSGLKLEQDGNPNPNVRTARLVAGSSDAGIGLTLPPENYSFLLPESWFACKEKLPDYHDNKEFVVFKQVNAGSTDHDAVSGCAPVRLVPECTELNDLPKGSAYMPKGIAPSHEFALLSFCYTEVKAIVWSKYGH